MNGEDIVGELHGLGGPDCAQMAREIRVHAERRAGELLAEQTKAKGSDYGGRTTLDGRRDRPSNPPKTLAEQGITRDQSSQWQKLAAVLWLDREFGWSEWTARNYMQVAKAFGEIGNDSRFENLTIDATALYALAAPLRLTGY